jgi:hypothetical protein
MTQIARGHFEGNTAPLCRRSHRSPARQIWQSKRAGGVADEAFIRVALSSAKLVIEVSHEKPPSGLRRDPVQQMKQRHGIHPARNGDKNPFAAPEQLSGDDGLLDVIHKVLHMAMLAGRWKRGQGDWDSSWMAAIDHRARRGAGSNGKTGD